MFSQLTLKQRLTMTFAAVLALASLLIGTALLNTARLSQSVHWNDHTHKVLAQSD
jgi:methyl-accepting chemotaxis protein